MRTTFISSQEKLCFTITMQTASLLGLEIPLAESNDTYTIWSVGDMLKNFSTRTTSIWKIRLASSGPNGPSPRLSGLD